MSDPKRATLITVGASKITKNNVNKTVRLTINLDESNESKYPELNYKELVIAEERKKKVENGKTTGLDPFSDNDDDVERVARKFEQKYGGKSTYGRKGRSKQDDFADIGAGYDENDSFIDNTHGCTKYDSSNLNGDMGGGSSAYDEMIPPECDTLYGGFYINCGSLEFKSVPENQNAISDAEPNSNRRNKRRISSSSSEDSSESSSESESADDKEHKPQANGALDSHHTEHRKKKNKKIDKKANKVRRTDSSAATSGKQTSDDNGHVDAESVDSRSSQSDSLTSKPAPSSENAITTDSSRDADTKVEIKLPAAVLQALEALEAEAARLLRDDPAAELLAGTDDHISRVQRALCGSGSRVRRAAWGRAATALRTTRARLAQRASRLSTVPENHTPTQNPAPSTAQSTTATTIALSVTSMGVTAATVTSTSTSVRAAHSKRKCEDDLEEFDPARLTHEDREAKIVETLARLKALIDERKPSMISNYNAECERVQEERKKIQIASAAEGAPHVEKRLPKRRFPWCARSRSLLARLTRLAASPDDAVLLLAKRALPLFPNGFVRMPTLLRQADLSKEIKVSDMKRQRIGSTSQMTSQHTVQFTEPVFPSSLTVTTTLKPSQEKNEVAVGTEEKPYKTNSVFGSIMNSFSLSKDLIIEKPDKKDNDKVKEDVYIPPNNIGSITITPVPNNLSKPEKKLDNNVQAPEKQSGFIRVKSPAALNEMVKKDKIKKLEKNVVKEKRVASPLHIDTNYQQNKKEPSPKSKEEIPQKHIDSMRVSENNIPRPGLIPVHHSPTFAKPDRRPPEVKKKKEILIVSDLDPLAADPQEPLAVDDSSSDVEVIEDNRTDKSEPKRDKCEIVPSKESVIVENNTKVNSVKCKSGKEKENHKSERDDATNEDINNLMKNIQEMAIPMFSTEKENFVRKPACQSWHSQEPTKFKNNAYAGVITSAIHEKSSSQYRRSAACGDTRADKDKLAERTSLNKMDGYNAITG